MSAATDAIHSISIVVPVFNEEESLRPLYDQVVEAMASQSRPWELVLVDDGSRDGSVAVLRELAALDHRVKPIVFRRNYGQSAAMYAGIQNATGDGIVTMDGDLQNDPRDIPMMIDRLEQGYDLVHGWRKNRQDHLVSRKIPSRVANWLISRTTKFPIHDLGCTLKAIRREIAQEIELYGEMHRFIPVLASRLGARCTEVVTRHRARQFGETSYGLGRTTRVIFDLLTVKFLIEHFDSPMKLFGKLGLAVGGIATISGVAAVAMKLISGVDLTGNPLLMLAAIGSILSVQFFSLGLLSEVCVRIYFASGGKKPYRVREQINFENELSVDSPVILRMYPDSVEGRRKAA